MSIDHTTGTTPFGFAATESNQLPPSDTSTSTSAVEFRVIRPGAPVRRLRLTGNRYTFGSAEGCSIRLTDPALRPMHAVLIRDAHRILVRAYSVPLDINGNRTTEAILNIGDVIRLGAYRFELLSAPGAQFASIAAQPAMPAHPIHTHPAPPLPQDDALWQERLRREAAQWRARQGDCDTRESQCTQRESILRDRESELWSRSEHLRHREVDLTSQESAVVHIREDYAAKKEEVSCLLEENHARQIEIDRRNEEYRALEAEYRQYADQAKAQLEQSQQQADTATEAVQKMRDQFASLNKQLEEFSRQQKDLEQARNSAIDAQAESEAKRQIAEERVNEVTSQLDTTRSELDATRLELDATRGELDSTRSDLDSTHSDLDSTRSDLESTRGDLESARNDLVKTQQEFDQERAEHEKQSRANQQLEQQVAELQSRVDEASSEASQLRANYESANASVRQLELLVDQTNSRGHDDYQSWVTETEQLRKSVEQLSVDLAQANAELSDLREANEALTRQLSDAEQQSENVHSDLQSRPTNDAFESLRQELDAANSRVQEMEREHEEAIERVNEQRKDDQRQVDQLLSEQREEERRIADERIAEALAQRDTQIAELNNVATADEPATEQSVNDEMDAEESSTTGLAASAIIGATGVLSSLVSSEEPNSTDEPELESTPDHQQDADEEGWPTYESESLSSQNLVAEVDSDLVDSITSDQDLLAGINGDATELTEQSSAWGNVSSEMQSPDIEADASAQESDMAADADDEPNDESSLWRLESEQSVESAGHFQAWDNNDSDDSDVELAAQDGDVQWQDESPEVSVNEMIDDIEHSVDQVITESESPESESPESESPVSDSPDTAWDDASEETLDSETVTGDYSQTATAWDSPSDTDASEINIDPSDIDDEPTVGQLGDGESDAGEAFVSDYQTENETTEDYGSYTEPSYESSQTESTESESYSSWSESSHETDHVESELEQSGEPDQTDESNEHSLADMLIRDLDANTDTEESPTDEVDPGENEHTYVMNEFSEVESQDDYETTQAWDHSNIESDDSADAYVDTESLADETVDNDDSFQNHEVTSDAPEVVSDEADAESNGASDDSIEAYMNRLLQRVQGDEEEEGGQMAETSTLTSATIDLENKEATAQAEAKDPEPVDVNAPLIPRSQAPERDRDLSAMRELANSSARSAVARSVRIQARNTQLKGFNKFLQVAVALSCAVACYFFLSMGPMIKIIGIVAILVIAGILAHEGFLLLTDARRRLQMADETAGGEQSDVDEPVEGLEDESEADDATASLGEPDSPDTDQTINESADHVPDEAKQDGV